MNLFKLLLVTNWMPLKMQRMISGKVVKKHGMTTLKILKMSALSMADD